MPVLRAPDHFQFEHIARTPNHHRLGGWKPQASKQPTSARRTSIRPFICPTQSHTCKSIKSFGKHTRQSCSTTAVNVIEKVFQVDVVDLCLGNAAIIELVLFATNTISIIPKLANCKPNHTS